MAELSVAAPSGKITGWQVASFAGPGDLERFSRRTRETLDLGNINQDVEWLSISHDWPRNKLLVLFEERSAQVVGLATFKLSRAYIDLSLGPLKIFRWPVMQYQVHEGPVVVGDSQDSAVADCFEKLARCMPRGSVVFAGDVPTAAEFHRQLADKTSRVRQNFHVMPWGEEAPHCGIRWEGSVEKYLVSLGKRSRKDLRRCREALLSDRTISCEVRCFERGQDVDAFLRDGILISDKTYQKNDLGLGLSWGGPVERAIRLAAERSCFLGYILYIDQKPAAFRYAFIAAKTCTMKQVGFDPAFASRQAGAVLLLETLYDFERRRIPVTYIDLLPYNTEFKLRVSNDKRPSRNYYLFKRDLVGRLQYMVNVATDGAARRVKHLIGHVALRGTRAGRVQHQADNNEQEQGRGKS